MTKSETIHYHPILCTCAANNRHETIDILRFLGKIEVVAFINNVMTAKRKNQRFQISLDLSSELYETLNELAHKINGDNAEVLLKAIALMEVAVEAKQNGKHIWIADENHNLEAEVVGI